MTPDQLPDSLQLRNLVRSLATLDLLVAAPGQPSIVFTPTSDPQTQAATLKLDDAVVWTFLFTSEGATLTLSTSATGGHTMVVSTVEQPAWQSTDPSVQLPDLLDGSPETSQAWLDQHYAKGPDLIPIRQILMSVPLTIDLAREFGNELAWADLRAAILPIGYPIADEDLSGPDNPHAGANLD